MAWGRGRGEGLGRVGLSPRVTLTPPRFTVLPTHEDRRGLPHRGGDGEGDGDWPVPSVVLQSVRGGVCVRVLPGGAWTRVPGPVVPGAGRSSIPRLGGTPRLRRQTWSERSPRRRCATASPHSHSDGTEDEGTAPLRCHVQSWGGEGGTGEGVRASLGFYMMLHFPLILSVLFCLLERFPSMVRLTFLLFSRFSSSWKSSLTL